MADIPGTLVRACVLALLTSAYAPAWAAHPLQTEDTGTQGEGNFELENGFAWVRSADRQVAVYQPQLSYGWNPDLDLIVQPSYVRTRSDGGRSSGWAATNLDLKWRFYGAAPVSFGVRAGASVAAADGSFGAARSATGGHALLGTTIDLAPFTLHGNISTAWNPTASGLRRWTPAVSGAAMWALDERLILTVDATANADPDPTRSGWNAQWLAGVIYTVRAGLDLDLGWQRSARTAPSVRQWLFGITYRFAP